MASHNISDRSAGGGGEDNQTTEVALVEKAHGSQALSANEKKQILRERARKLAIPPDEDYRGQEFLEVIEFVLAHERYAMDVRYVKEVYPLKDLTPLPCTPSFVLGILNVRGQVVSVTDIKHFFDLPAKEPSDEAKVLILENHKMEMGILADAVIGERKIPLTDIQSDLPMLRGLREQYVRGVTKDRLVVMDAEKILSDDAMVIHQEVGD